MHSYVVRYHLFNQLGRKVYGEEGGGGGGSGKKRGYVKFMKDSIYWLALADAGEIWDGFVRAMWYGVELQKGGGGGVLWATGEAIVKVAGKGVVRVAGKGVVRATGEAIERVAVEGVVRASWEVSCGSCWGGSCERETWRVRRQKTERLVLQNHPSSSL